MKIRKLSFFTAVFIFGIGLFEGTVKHYEWMLLDFFLAAFNAAFIFED